MSQLRSRVEKVRQELFDLSSDGDYSTEYRAAYRDASRAIGDTLAAPESPFRNGASTWPTTATETIETRDAPAPHGDTTPPAPTADRQTRTAPNTEDRMTLLHKVEIQASGRGSDSHVKLDGRDIGGGIRRFTLEQEVGQPTTLELELVVIETTRVNAEDCHVYLHAASRDLIERLGWTPPVEDPEGVTVHHFGKTQPIDPEDFAIVQAAAAAHNQ